MNITSYERITDYIVGLMEKGTVPWHMPWKVSAGLPRNLISKKAYRGINPFLLRAAGYDSPYWLTFRQASQLGGSVKKGEKACPVVFWKQLKVEDQTTDGTKKIPLLRFYYVFNVAQCDELKLDAVPTDTTENGITKPDDIVAAMPQRPVIKHGMARAYYSRSLDYVGMPPREKFEREEGYFSVLFHELVHATGHEKRLNRNTLIEAAGFDSDPYCKEELVAEMGAAFLCAEAEIVERTVDNSASYIKGWLGKLKDDKTLLVQAAAQAQKAADFILNRTFKESEAARD